MSKIVFINDPNTIYDGQFSQIGSHQVRLIFTDIVPSDDILLSGFSLVNEHNGAVQTKRNDYTYIYRKYSDSPNQIELCNDNKPWVKPEIIVTFSASNGGNLSGEVTQIVEKYEDLVVPTPIADENYEFLKWNPEIPTSGTVENNVTFVAEFKYIPTEEELKQILEKNKSLKISESKELLSLYLEEHPLVSKCHNNTEATYNVTSEKQTLMSSNYLAYTIAKQSGIENPVLTWNASGCECEEWTEEEFVQLILEVSTYVKPLVSQQQSYEVAIKECSTQEELDSIQLLYG